MANWFKTRGGHPIRWAVGGYFGFWFLYFLWFWSRAISFDPFGNLISGHVNIWGDWALHFTMGSAMAYRKLVLLESPLLLHAPFGYPFLCDFISAVLIRAGVPFFRAFTVPSFLFSLLFVWALYWLYRNFFKSERTALISSLIFIFNGGIGFWIFLKDVVKAKPFWKALLYPPREYTILRDVHIEWASVISSMVIPQRSFQIGFPLALISLGLVFKYQGLQGFPENGVRLSRKVFYLTLASVILGLMPITQAYAFLACFVILGFWVGSDFVCSGRDFFRRKIQFWGGLVAVTALIAVPLLSYFIWPNLSRGSFFHWNPGGFAGGGGFGLIRFWFRNWTIVPVLSLLGAVLWIWRDNGFRQRMGKAVFSFPFFFLFIAVNLFIFQPWAWDNTKILAWASLGMSGFAGYFLDRMFFEKNFSLRLFPFGPLGRKIVGGFLFFFMTASGILDAYRVQIPRLNSNQMYSAEDLFLASWVRQNTPADSLWLAAPFHNNWLFNLTGRRVLMGYEGWLWTHGYKYQNIISDLRIMFRNPQKKELFDKYGVDYVMAGPIEERDFKADPALYSSLFHAALTTEHYGIFSVKGTPDARIEGFGGALILDQTIRISTPLKIGLDERIFKGIYFQGDLLKARTGVTNLNFDYPYDPSKPYPAPFSLIWEGFLEIQGGGIYKFSLASDDGSWLYLDDREVIENGGIHQVAEKSARAFLRAGFHKIRIKYFDHHGGAVFSLKWQPPDGKLSEIPEQYLLSKM